MRHSFSLCGGVCTPDGSLFKGRKPDTSKQEALAEEQLRESRRQHRDNMKFMEAQLELAMRPIPVPPPTPPPVSETSADVAQAEDALRKRLRRKSGLKSVFAGERGGKLLGGVASALGRMVAPVMQGGVNVFTR